MTPLRPWLPLSFLAFVAACSTPVDRVVLLPQAAGTSAVVVTTATASAELNTPYAATELGRKGEIKAAEFSEAQVKERFPDLLRLLPPPPQTFVLSFIPGTSNLTPESLAQLDAVVAAAKARSGGEIVVIGHTDRQGAADANDALSLRRANAIRGLLIQKGFQGDLVLAIGRGEREPVVATEDNVAEARNRRAEIIIR